MHGCSPKTIGEASSGGLHWTVTEPGKGASRSLATTAQIIYSAVMNDKPLFCDRCSIELWPGKGDFYVVKIEAVADPSPPIFDEEDLRVDPLQEIDRLIEAARQLSPQEALDQVYRRLTIFLCARCYQDWIENPVG